MGVKPRKRKVPKKRAAKKAAPKKPMHLVVVADLLEKKVKSLTSKNRKLKDELVDMKIELEKAQSELADANSECFNARESLRLAAVSKVVPDRSKAMASDILVAIRRHPSSMALTQQLTQAGVIVKLEAAANARCTMRSTLR